MRTAADGDPGALDADPELVRTLNALLRLAGESCPSCLAVAVTADSDGADVTLTASTTRAARGAQAVSALTVHLPRHGTNGTNTRPQVLAVYADDRSELERLGADIIALLEIDPGKVTLRTGASVPALDAADQKLALALSGLSSYNRALGVLLQEGWLPDDGHTELQRRADRASLTLTPVSYTH